MTKKTFIELADWINYGPIENIINRFNGNPVTQHSVKMEIANSLADFCASQNPNFNRERWLDYIEGKCGPSGGKI